MVTTYTELSTHICFVFYCCLTTNTWIIYTSNKVHVNNQNDVQALYDIP